MTLMKIHKRLSLAGVFVLCTYVLQSCEDFLTVYPVDATTEEQFWQDKKDLDFVRSAAYKKLTDRDANTPINIYEGPTAKIFCWGELRTDNFVVNTRDEADIIKLQEGVLMPTAGMFDWAEFYQGINYCNMVLTRGQRMLDENIDPSFSEGEWRPIKAEMQALRALYYFYLVRAFRDVPYVSVPISTDAEALRSRIAATPGIAILGDLIDSLEVAQNYAAINFGTTQDNKGRFTKMGIRTLLADLYLWRGCMLKNYYSKMREGLDSIVNLTDQVEEGVITTKTGTTINASYFTQESQRCFEKSIEYCDMVLDYMKGEYKKRLDRVSNPSPLLLGQDYPLERTELFSITAAAIDMVYQRLFASKNSDESIFEIQFDGENNVNGVLPNFLSSYSSKSLVAKKLSVNPSLANLGAVELDNGFGRGFGKTDFRALEVMDFQPGNSTVYPFVKGVAQSIIINDVQDMAEGATYRYRVDASQDANWPVYRLSDLMLIKAEAIARTANPTTANLNEAFNMVNSIFARNNPAATVDDGELKSVRLGGFNLTTGAINISDRNYFATDKNAEQLLRLVYRERQREFVGEGKFWFDLVREAEATNDPMMTLAGYLSLRSEVRARLRHIYSLYCPIYNAEMKINGVEYGGLLYQNPVWDRYSSK